MLEDKETAAFMQTAFGYALTGETRYECLFVLYGKLTRNGKGTLCESVMRVMGDYGRSVKVETIAQKHNQLGNMPSEDFARLAGVRFANISEPDQRLELNAAQVKSMTGNDKILARFLYENSFEFYPRFKIYINTNYRPNICDMTLFTSNRVYIIPFERHFEGSEQDLTLKDEFQKPLNQTGILNWLVEGYRLLKERGLKPFAASVSATQEYRHDSDKISQFIEDVLTPDPNGEERTQSVYNHYKVWCKQNGLRHEGINNFKQAFSSIAVVERKRPRGGGNLTTLLFGYTLPDSGYGYQQTLWD
jgi:putative DNA primase/helicase